MAGWLGLRRVAGVIRRGEVALWMDLYFQYIRFQNNIDYEQGSRRPTEVTKTYEFAWSLGGAGPMTERVGVVGETY
jgi:hypothetical protein